MVENVSRLHRRPVTISSLFGGRAGDGGAVKGNHVGTNPRASIGLEAVICPGREAVWASMRMPRTADTKLITTSARRADQKYAVLLQNRMSSASTNRHIRKKPICPSRLSLWTKRPSPPRYHSGAAETKGCRLHSPARQEAAKLRACLLRTRCL